MAQVVLKHVNKSYGNTAAVNDVSFTVQDGEFVALVGPSGCGKTTTLNLIAGLIPLTSGEIRIGDREVSALDPKDRDIAMVFQNYALYPNKTVFNNLAFPLQMRKQPKDVIDKKVRDAARVLDITHLLDRKPRELSGGQQQRVALGRALVRDPAAFLMDEPLSNLDAKLRVQMRSEIKRFHHNLNATIVYVTHDQLEAVTMADKMAVMHGGLLQQYDSPANVFANPVNTFVASFVGSPAMSLIPVDVVSRGGGAVLKGAGGWELPLSDFNARKTIASSSGKAVLGARHSTLTLHKDAKLGTVPGQGAHGRADRRCHFRADPDRQGDRQHQPAADRGNRAGPACLGRVRSGADAPFRRCDNDGAEGGVMGRCHERPVSFFNVVLPLETS